MTVLSSSVPRLTMTVTRLTSDCSPAPYRAKRLLAHQVRQHPHLGAGARQHRGWIFSGCCLV